MTVSLQLKHPLLLKHPRFTALCNFVARWLLLAEGLVGIVDVVDNWHELIGPYGILVAFNHKNGLITNHVASIAAISAVSLYFFARSARVAPLVGALWVGLIIAVHENLWWLTHLFFLRGQAWQAYLFYGSLNYPMAMLVLYLLVMGWGRRETLLLGLVAAYYVVWALMGFHVTSDVTGNTIWLNSVSTNITESLSWIYACVCGVICYEKNF